MNDTLVVVILVSRSHTPRYVLLVAFSDFPILFLRRSSPFCVQLQVLSHEHKWKELGPLLEVTFLEYIWIHLNAFESAPAGTVKEGKVVLSQKLNMTHWHTLISTYLRDFLILSLPIPAHRLQVSESGNKDVTTHTHTYTFAFFLHRPTSCLYNHIFNIAATSLWLPV